jgi:hypothetical protein
MDSGGRAEGETEGDLAISIRALPVPPYMEGGEKEDIIIKSKRI